MKKRTKSKSDASARPSRKEITLEQWADAQKRPRRTVSHWAKTGKIPAVKRRVTMEVTRFVTVTKYMIRSDARVPEEVK